MPRVHFSYDARALRHLIRLRRFDVSTASENAARERRASLVEMYRRGMEG